jgi:hypothetical protein
MQDHSCTAEHVLRHLEAGPHKEKGLRLYVADFEGGHMTDE